MKVMPPAVRLGPYKGYRGVAERDAESGWFHGTVKLPRDVVAFEGRDLAQLAATFIASVNDYLQMCHESGVAPEQPVSTKDAP